MKTRIIFILLCFLSLNVMGQGIITRESTRRTKPKTTQPIKTKTKTKTASKPKAEKTCDICGKVLSKCEYKGNHPEPEAAGYDVTFSCNVSSALLYIDGNANGSASGSRFLKTGSHNIKVTAEGYKDYVGNINVRRQNTLCKITLEKKPEPAKPVLIAPTIGTSTYIPQVKTYTANGVSFSMIEVRGGTFQMGATSEQKNPYDSEKPVHSVTLSSYYIGETEVTQELWKAVMGKKPSNFKGSSNPVEKVSWNDCQEFISRLNSLTGQRFRLPTEAEWEYAARGGSKSRGYQYSGSNNLFDVAWYGENSGNKTHPVKTKQPNELGIYDMSGNIWEWCQDWYGSYSSSSQTNPTGASSGSGRVIRGGSWGINARFCRVAYRFGITPGGRLNGLGLRLALSE